LDNDRRELPERRKVNAPVENEQAFGNNKTYKQGTQGQAGDRRVFLDQRSPINRRRAKDKRKVSLPVIIESRVPEKGEAEKTGGLCAERHK